MDAQLTYERLTQISEQSKLLAEEKAELLNNFAKEHGDYEYPVTVDGKQKYFRVYPTDGRFVYNTLLDMGLRVKPQNLPPVEA